MNGKQSVFVAVPDVVRTRPHTAFHWRQKQDSAAVSWTLKAKEAEEDEE